jgi:hypothetical protein
MEQTGLTRQKGVRGGVVGCAVQKAHTNQVMGEDWELGNFGTSN